jgi:kinesin family protein 5
VPYRDSKLTRLLKDSLGGNFKTTLIVTCSPHSFNVEETISTLNFAKRTKNVQNKVKANIKKSPEEFEKIIERLEEKIKELTEENNRLYSGPTSPSIRRDGYCESNKDIKEVLVKEKEEEKLKIKEEIDNLKTEKEDLEKEVKRMKNDLNLGKTIETLEKSFRNNVNDMENMILKYQTQTEGYYKEELLKLKEKLVMKQGSEIDKIKDLISNQKEFKDFKNNFQQINKNVKDFLENNLNCFQKENDITLSDDTFPRKSVNIILI